MDAVICILGSLATLYFAMELGRLIEGQWQTRRRAPTAVRTDNGEPITIVVEDPEAPRRRKCCRHGHPLRPARSSAY